MCLLLAEKFVIDKNQDIENFKQNYFRLIIEENDKTILLKSKISNLVKNNKELLGEITENSKQFKQLLLKFLFGNNHSEETLNSKLKKHFPKHEIDVEMFFPILLGFANEFHFLINGIKGEYQRKLSESLKFSFSKEEEMLERFPFLNE